MNGLKRYERRANHLPGIFNRLNDDFFTNFMSDNLPATNVIENKNEYKIEISAPGMEKEDFKLEIDKNVLKISAHKETKNEEKDEDEKVWRQEFSSSSFSRSFVLPDNIDTENIMANQKDGVLKITLPKMEKAPEEAVKTIEIQ